MLGLHAFLAKYYIDPQIPFLLPRALQSVMKNSFDMGKRVCFRLGVRSRPLFFNGSGRTTGDQPTPARSLSRTPMFGTTVLRGSGMNVPTLSSRARSPAIRSFNSGSGGR